MQEICLVGFGAIGALYAYVLSRSGEARVTVVCRSNYKAVNEQGLDVNSDQFGQTHGWEPYRVLRTVHQAADREYDFVICTFKAYLDIQATWSKIAPLLEQLTPNSPTAFVLIQNGIGIEDDMLESLQARRLGHTVISGCAWVDTTLSGGGRVVTQHGKERLVLGYHVPKDNDLFSQQNAQASLDALQKLLKAGGGNAEIADIEVARWKKVLWNSSFSTLCTLARCRVCDVLAVPQSRAALRTIMLEVLTVARACVDEQAALALPDSMADKVIENENPKSVFKPSMLVDLEAGRPIEVEAIIGGIVRRASEAGVAVPQLDLIYASLRLVQQNLLPGTQPDESTKL